MGSDFPLLVLCRRRSSAREAAMPATTIFGLRVKHLATDFCFMYFNVGKLG